MAFVVAAVLSTSSPSFAKQCTTDLYLEHMVCKGLTFTFSPLSTEDGGALVGSATMNVLDFGHREVARCFGEGLRRKHLLAAKCVASSNTEVVWVWVHSTPLVNLAMANGDVRYG